MEKRPFFRAATAGLGKYHTGGYGRIGVYRVKKHLFCRNSNFVCDACARKLSDICSVRKG